GYDLDFDLSAPSIMPLYTFIESALYENSNPKTAGRFTLRKLAEHIPKLRCAPKGKITQKLIDVHLVRPLNALQSAGIDYRLEWRSHCRPSAPPKITRANFSKVLVVIDPQFPIWTKQDDLLKSAANKSIEIEIDAEREAA
ncbi:MAG: hypothetical protein FWD93_04050, partial [Coriobacteriia bacterium]|nr:hypothetical protein [Coriobacteriia bacterium]